MISNQLKPMERQPEIGLNEIAEALAFSYWAYYSTDSTQPRVLEAYKRAWAFDSVKKFARTDARPGFLVAFFTLEARRLMLVAIEGSTGIPALTEMIALNLSSRPTGNWGSTYTFFNSRAAAIYSAIQADTDCAAAIADGGYITTFTGHSLGAACADLVANTFLHDHPTRAVRLIKFGAPRVGNTLYVNRTTNRPKSVNVLCGNDPIHQFPSSTIFAAGAINMIGAITRLNPCSEDSALILPMGPDRCPHVEPLRMTQSFGHFLDVIAASGTLTDATNVWYHHLVKTYRMAMMNVCGEYSDTLRYRFNFLEHNDENAWQTRWAPQQRSWANLDVLNVTAPDDAPPFSAALEEEITYAETSTSGGGDWGNEAARVEQSDYINRSLMQTIPPIESTATAFRRRLTRTRPQ